MPDDWNKKITIPKVTIHEVFVRDPPGWFRKIGNGEWESISLAPYNGMLPVVWLNHDVRVTQQETWSVPSVALALRSKEPEPR